VNRNRKTYYTQQWMYGFQFAPTRNDVLDITYVGNHGVHVQASGLNLNQLDPKYFSMGNTLLNQVPNPFFGQITSSGCSLDQPTIAQGQLLGPTQSSVTSANLWTPQGARTTTPWISITHTVCLKVSPFWRPTRSQSLSTM